MVYQNAAGINVTGVVSADGVGAFTGTTFTTGSVSFGASNILSQDNTNFFWDDTNKRLGIGTTTPTDTLVVVGDVDIIHTAVESNDHTLELEVNADGFNDVKVIDIIYATGALGATEEDAIISINIDETLAAGGELFAMEVLSTAIGSVVKAGLKVGTGIGAVSQSSGVFVDADSILNKAVDVTAALADGGAGNISVFVADNDTVTIGDAAKFEEIEVIVDTVASGAGIAPTFEYSTGVGLWSTFGPIDGTNGLRNTGNIAWEVADISGWMTSGGEYLIRWTRTRNSLGTTPILDEIQIAEDTEFLWDKNGDVNFNSLTLLTPLVETSGGTGQSTITAGDLLYGSAANTISKLAKGTDTQVLTLAAGIPSWAAPATAGTVTSVSGTTNRISSTGGATPVIDIDAAYVGQTSITTLGTVTTGIWTGTTVAVANGGTGAATFTDNALLRGQVTAALDPTSVLVSDAGEMTNASQPAFLAYLTSTDSNVTGNGTAFTVGGTTAFTEVFDQGADFNTNGTFTAPVAGRYFLQYSVRCTTATDATTVDFQMVTSNRTYRKNDNISSLASQSWNTSVLADMDASDTATYTIKLTGIGADTANVVGGTPLDTYVSGELLA